MLNDLPIWMAICLLLTILIETGIAALCGVRKKEDLLCVLLVNVLTNPLLVVSLYWIGWQYGAHTRKICEYGMEIAVVLIEGLIYHAMLKCRKPRPLLLSLLLNGASYGTGLLMNILLQMAWKG